MFELTNLNSAPYEDGELNLLGSHSLQVMIRMRDSPVPSCTRILDPVISSNIRLVVVVDKLTISQVTLSIIRLDYGRTPTPTRPRPSFEDQDLRQLPQQRRRLQGPYRGVGAIALVSFLTTQQRSSTPVILHTNVDPTPSTNTVDQQQSTSPHTLASIHRQRETIK